MKKILMIQGHPDKESFNFAIHSAYREAAKSAGADVKEIIVADLEFNPNLEFGYRKRTDLEVCLQESQQLILWADHIVLIHPVWWGSVPAILKGFIDRVFLPGFAFKKRENSVWWDKYLQGRSGHLIATLDQPWWYYWLVYRSPSVNALKKLTFEFCGISPVRVTNLGPVRGSSPAQREKWLRKIAALGARLK